MTTYECNKLLPQHRDVTHNENVTREDHVAQRRKQSSAQHTIETDQKHVRVRVHSVILVAVEFTVLSRDQQRHLCACNHLVVAFIQRCSQQFTHRCSEPSVPVCHTPTWTQRQHIDKVLWCRDPPDLTRTGNGLRDQSGANSLEFSLLLDALPRPSFPDGARWISSCVK